MSRYEERIVAEKECGRRRRRVAWASVRPENEWGGDGDRLGEQGEERRRQGQARSFAKAILTRIQAGQTSWPATHAKAIFWYPFSLSAANSAASSVTMLSRELPSIMIVKC